LRLTFSDAGSTPAASTNLTLLFSVTYDLELVTRVIHV
jgi:hypothetical protein